MSLSPLSAPVALKYRFNRLRTKRLRLWRMDQSDFNTDYPFKCDAVIRTGHTANIFNAQMLPFSTRIATVAGDKQVRVFDIGTMAAASPGSETVHQTRDTCIRVIRCHGARTKRIVAEESSDLFLTVAEVSGIPMVQVQWG